MNESYSKRVRDRMQKKFPDDQKGGLFRGRNQPHILKELEYNFIDGTRLPQKCVKGTLTAADIKYHYAEHLNSSQTMCIAYFKKFFECTEYECLLIEILKRLGFDTAAWNGFTDAVFEHIPNAKEKTNFDFYLRTGDGRQIIWEVKFTENEFGSIRLNSNSGKYIAKYRDIYIDLLRAGVFCNCPATDPEHYPCLATDVPTDLCRKQDGCAIKEFYQHYQIRRNILYAKKKDDYVLFLTPRENEQLNEGRKYIDRYAEQWGTNHIRNIYWEDLLEITLQVVSHVPVLLDYYTRFNDKYFVE